MSETEGETDVSAEAGQDPEHMDEFARRLEDPPPPVAEEWEIAGGDTDSREPMEGEAPTG